MKIAESCTEVKYKDQLKDITDNLSPQSFRAKRYAGLWGRYFKIFVWNPNTDAKKCNQQITQQKKFVHISKEQMTVLKSAITSFNLTMQKVGKKEKLLAEELRNLNKMVVDDLHNVQYQVD
jgi:hypothetical protein